MKDVCRGCQANQNCFLYNIKSFRLTRIFNDVVHLCPCRFCLVKGICNELCEDYFKYTHMVKRKIGVG